MTLAACSDDDSTATPNGTTGDDGTPAASTGADSGDTGASDETGSAPSPYVGEPLEVTPDSEWAWFDLPGVQCADGADSGVGVRHVPDSEGLVLYFKGGGACFNESSCALSMPQLLTGFDAIDANPDGLLDFDAPDNPLANYDIVYFPYCTGDVHAGTQSGATVDGLDEPWDFVGHTNVLTALERIGPTFADAPRILVLGTSAGGIGALINFPSIAAGWPDAEKFMLDDSGMLFRDAYLAPCLQQRMRQTWGLEGVLPTDCPECEAADGGGMSNYLTYLADRYPDTHFGLVASTRDLIVRIFFGYGDNECDPGAGLPDLGEATLMAALTDLQTEVLTGRFATYIVDSDVHVWTVAPDFFNVESGGVPLRTWFADFMRGDAPDVLP